MSTTEYSNPTFNRGTDEAAALTRLYEFFSQRKMPQGVRARIGVVFGCAVPSIGQDIVQELKPYPYRALIISGGIGKDSGFLPRLNPPVPEAAFVLSTAVSAGMPAFELLTGEPLSALQLQSVVDGSSPLLVGYDPLATHGGQNAKNSIEVIVRSQLAAAGLPLVAMAPGVRLLRLMITLREAAEGLNVPIGAAPVGSYPGGIDPGNPVHVREVIGEVMRLLFYPRSGISHTHVPELERGGSLRREVQLLLPYGGRTDPKLYGDLTEALCS